MKKQIGTEALVVEHLSNESIADTNFQDHPQDAPQLNHFRQETMLHNARVAYVTAAALVPGCPRKNLADQGSSPQKNDDLLLKW